MEKVLIFFFSILGKAPDTSFITNYFNDAYGGAAKPNSVLRWWPYGIWAHYSDVDNSEQCAFRCYIRESYSCSFYYWGSGYCHLGNFNSAGHSLVGGYDENTKYHIRKDFGKNFFSLKGYFISKLEFASHHIGPTQVKC